ncbi:hypothetical protein DFH11DRAFT_1582301 [Phellopilus nigrolimitatus]|nr:hypothetical protein DFH11DRAFT_1582301 [Phellopilus nigrolimitatus]
MIAHRSSHPALVHSQSQCALAHSAGQSQHASVGSARATARQDTLLPSGLEPLALRLASVCHSQSHARSATAITGGGTGSRGSSVNEEDLLDGDGDGVVEEEDAVFDGEGDGGGEGDMDIDTEIARAPQTGPRLRSPRSRSRRTRVRSRPCR